MQNLIEDESKIFSRNAIICLGIIFTFFSAQYYAEVGRLNTNITLIAGGTLLIGVILIVTAILLYSLVSVVREGKAR